MIIDKSVDVLQVGSNLLSLIMGVNILGSGRSTLIVDDSRASYGGLYLEYLSELEVNFLKAVGVTLDIGPLKEIDKFLDVAPTMFSINRTLVRLGEDYEANYRELARKFPTVFFKDKFRDEQKVITFIKEIRELTRTLPEELFSRSQTTSFDEYSFSKKFTEESKLMLNILKNGLKDALSSEKMSDLDIVTLVCSAGSFYQGIFTTKRSCFELYHLIISLISPLYKVNRVELEEDLRHIFIERGGNHLKSNISSWQFDDKKPWAFEMDSFNGIVHPSKLLLTTGFSDNLPIRVKHERELYRGLQIRFKFDHNFIPTFNKNLFMFASGNLIGTEIPVWYGKLADDGYLEVYVIVSFGEGVKEDFVINKAVGQVLGDIEALAITDELTLAVEKSQFTADTFLGRYGDVEKCVVKQNSFSKIELFEMSAPANSDKLKNVDYVGPLVEGPLGLFSAMVGMKEVVSSL